MRGFGRKGLKRIWRYVSALCNGFPVGMTSTREEGKGIEGVALPVYVGKMIYVGNWAASSTRSDLPGRIDLDPDFLLGADDLRHDPRAGSRVVFRDISNSTNERSFVSALLPGLFPCGNVLPVIEPSANDTSLKVEFRRVSIESGIRLGYPAAHVRHASELARSGIPGIAASGLDFPPTP